MEGTDNGKKATTRRTRTVDYSRTDKRPHSFRYKRGSAFEPRLGDVALAKEADGTLIIGPAAEGAQSDAATYKDGTITLISVKKRPNGKTAIVFKHDSLGELACYDARIARASLRAS